MNTYSIVILIIAIFSLLPGIIALRYRETKGTNAFCLLVIAIFIYAFGYSMELASTTVESMRIWNMIQYIGIASIPAWWLVFVIQYTGNDRWLKKYAYVLIFLIPVFTLGFNFSYPYCNLYYTSINVNHQAPFQFLLITKGAWYWVQAIFDNLSALSGIVLLLGMIVKSSKYYRKRAYIILFGSMPVWIFNLITVTVNSPHNMDLTAFALLITIPVYAWGMYRYQILEIVPLALENVFESMPDGVIILDIQKRILNVNPAVREILTVLSSRSISKPIEEVIAGYPEILSLVKGDISIENNKSIELKLNNREFYHIEFSAISDKQCIQVGFIIIFKDITIQKNAEIMLQQSEKSLKETNATKEKFFSIIAHDLRTPIGNIMNLSGYFLEERKKIPDEDQDKILRLLKDSSKSVYELLENLLEWTKSQRGKITFSPDYFLLNSLVNENLELVKTAASNKEVTIINQIEGDVQCYADRNMLNVIIRNLLVNALHFSRRKGIIYLTAKTSKNTLIICVADNGIGIPHEVQQKLFKIEEHVTTFGTENEQGSGLGLLLCKEFVDRHHGKITIESDPGFGAKFCVSLPMFP